MKRIVSRGSRTFSLPILLAVMQATTLKAEPIIVNGGMVPGLIGAPIRDLRVLGGAGKPLLFQIDERTPGGDYVCGQGERPNADSGDGMLGKQDEIVFLWEDIDSGAITAAGNRSGAPSRSVRCSIRRGEEERTVTIAENPGIPLPAAGAIDYDHKRQYVRTPYYYAQFSPDRFHFVRAGCMDFDKNDYIDLTNELRVEIVLKALWGLLPIRYTEENIVCLVKRYKAGPLRLIRRGDFYLNLGMGFKGSRAAVNQLCYPQMVEVPVRVNLPIRFNLLFSEAFIEMTPVIRPSAVRFRFSVPSRGYSKDLAGETPFDTLIQCIPDKGYNLYDGAKGFGWLMRIDARGNPLYGSGYLLRRPSKRDGMADCGFRLTLRDLPKGNYTIVNWVFFSRHSLASSGSDLGSALGHATIATPSGTYPNLLFGAGSESGADTVPSAY